MAIEFKDQQILGVMAGTLAQYTRDNPQPQPDENNVGDADEFGMYAMATGFLRLYYECIKAGIITPPTGEVAMPTPTHDAPDDTQ